ncbi:MAG: homoserine O-acetyltransferase [Thermodesulfobacteriota bacterium]
MSDYEPEFSPGGSVGRVEKKHFTFAEPPARMELECGRPLGPVTLAYETYGALAPAADNAILVCHALSGDSHAAGYYDVADRKPGWWDLYVGPGKAFDTDRYFVVCSNVIGGCMGSTGPGSVNPETGRPWGLDFPMLTIGDWVEAQRALVEHLGVRRLLAVAGGSIGGMQVLEWAVRFPDMVQTAIPLATTPKHSALCIAFNEVARQAIMTDPQWNGGAYYDGPGPRTGLSVARMIGHITYLSDEAMRRKFDRRLQDRCDLAYNFDAEFQVESYLRHQGRKFVERFDANSFLYITRAADYFNLEMGWGGGSLVKAFSRARARFLVVSFTSDWLYPTAQSRLMVQAMKKAGRDVSFVEISADCGHDAFLLPNPRLGRTIAGFLEQAARERSGQAEDGCGDEGGAA